MPDLMKVGQRVEVGCYEEIERGTIEQVREDLPSGPQFFVRLDKDQDGMEWRGWYTEEELDPIIRHHQGRT